MGKRLLLCLSEANVIFVRLEGSGHCAKGLVCLGNSGPNVKLLEEQNFNKHVVHVFRVKITNFNFSKKNYVCPS